MYTIKEDGATEIIVFSVLSNVCIFIIIFFCSVVFALTTRLPRFPKQKYGNLFHYNLSRGGPSPIPSRYGEFYVLNDYPSD